MEPTDITVEILKDIRAEIRSTNARLETGLADVSRRIVDSEIRTATAITELAGSVHDLTDLLRASHDLRPRVERCESEIADIKRRLA
jgi:hypothetical protein